jgi:hypothetical protein
MVAMAVGQHDMGDALDRRLFVRDEGRISGEERINQHHMAGEIQPERGMAEPSDLHGGRPLPRRGSGPGT